MNDIIIEAAVNYKEYLKSSKDFFERSSSEMKKLNHNDHNLEHNFWKYMVIPYKKSNGNYGLEYGCGAGRNLVNLLEYCGFKRVDGIDISKTNCKNSMDYVESIYSHKKSRVFEGNGYSCYPLKDSFYSLVISHQVFIHIPNRIIRKSILTDIYRVLAPGGKVMIHYKSMTSSVAYNVNANKFPLNVAITQDDFDSITTDFRDCGFSSITIYKEKNYYDGNLEVFITGTISSNSA